MVEIFAISGVHPSDLFPRGSRIRRVVRPGMLGIASFELFFHHRVAGRPKTGQIVGDLLRAGIRRQQVQQDWDSPESQTRGFLPREYLLNFDGQDGSFPGFVGQTQRGAAGDFEPPRRLTLQNAQLVTGEQTGNPILPGSLPQFGKRPTLLAQLPTDRLQRLEYAAHAKSVHLQQRNWVLCCLTGW